MNWSAYLIIAVLIAIVATLARAMLTMLRGGGDRTHTARALTWRIGLSVALFLTLLLGFATGVLKPHGVQREFGPAAPEDAPAQSQ